VLPITDALRSLLARGADTEELEAAALSAGMQSLTSVGLARMKAGVVSAGELERVLRFAE
ncbi:MAG: type II secretion system protein GspE, partial [Coriobacteriia bacterium]|nr:type II secretion system protein GspE [Coriobacteriia bacterium]